MKQQQKKTEMKIIPQLQSRVFHLILLCGKDSAVVTNAGSKDSATLLELKAQKVLWNPIPPLCNLHV